MHMPPLLIKNGTDYCIGGIDKENGDELLSSGLVLRLSSIGSRPIVVIGCSGSQRFVTETLFLMIHIGFAASILYQVRFLMWI